MLSLTHQFLAWCRSKPATEEYDFWSTREGRQGCAVTQFIATSGREDWSREWGRLHGECGDALFECPWTFGALADRVERQLAEQGQVS